MRTQVLADSRTRFPWLETAAPNSALAPHVDLDRLPFTIGRNESCDLTIPSTRVSREHAIISAVGNGHRIQDGGSTNGTFVNGQRVQEQAIVDGDIILIADVEFSFHYSQSSAERITVTQPFAGSGEPTIEDNEAQALVQAVRRRQEALLHRALRLRFQPIIDLQTNQPLGYEALRRPSITCPEIAPIERLLTATECRLIEREHELLRTLAVEQATRLTGCSRLLLGLESAEVGADALPDTLVQLQDRLGAGRQVVASLPDSAVADIPYFRSFIAKLRELAIGVAFDGFAGGPHQVEALAPFAPDYLKLATTLVRGIDRSTDRQRQVQAIVQAANKQQIAVIAAGVHSEAELEACRRLGCPLAQGDHLGLAQTVDWPLAAAESPL